MGKKDFAEKFTPFEAQIERDREKIAAMKARGQETAAPLASPPAAAPKPAAAPEPAQRPNLPFEDEDDANDDAYAPRPTPPQARPRETAPPPRIRLPEPPRPPSQTLTQNTAALDRVEVSPRLKVSQAAFQDLETALKNFHRATGSQIHYSIATRALWGLLIQAEAQVLEEFRKHPLGRLPSTRDKLAYAEYEERVKQVFAQAFRKLPRTLFQSVPSQESGEG